MARVSRSIITGAVRWVRSGAFRQGFLHATAIQRRGNIASMLVVQRCARISTQSRCTVADSNGKQEHRLHIGPPPPQKSQPSALKLSPGKMVGNGAGTRKGRVQPQYSVEAGSAKTWGVLVLCVLFGSWSLRWQQRVRRTHYHLLAWEDRVCAYSAPGAKANMAAKVSAGQVVGHLPDG